MSKVTLTLFTLILSVLTSCNEHGPAEGMLSPKQPAKTLPAGSIVATDTIPVLEDQLNNSQFSVTVFTTDKTATKGLYSVETVWGHNIANTEFYMPKGAEDAPLTMKKGTEPYSYIVGFTYGDDTTFYDYYLVTAIRGQIATKYTKGYRLQ